MEIDASGAALGLELEGQYGVINGNAHAGAVSVAPLARRLSRAAIGSR